MLSMPVAHKLQLKSKNPVSRKFRWPTTAKALKMTMWPSVCVVTPPVKSKIRRISFGFGPWDFGVRPCRQLPQLAIWRLRQRSRVQTTGPCWSLKAEKSSPKSLSVSLSALRLRLRISSLILQPASSTWSPSRQSWGTLLMSSIVKAWGTPRLPLPWLMMGVSWPRPPALVTCVRPLLVSMVSIQLRRWSKFPIVTWISRYQAMSVCLNWLEPIATTSPSSSTVATSRISFSIGPF